VKYPDEIPANDSISAAPGTEIVKSQAMYACPRHGTAMADKCVGKIRVWHCEGCSGLWLPAGAFHANVGHVSVVGRGRPAGLSCPKDGHALTTVMHRGIEVEVCGTCGGVWFDRGELQKILAQSTDPAARCFLDGNSGSTPLDMASVAVDMVSVGDFAGEVISAVFEFMAGLAS
jgi:Zn-finger nucleic acid-binding protein